MKKSSFLAAVGFFFGCLASANPQNTVKVKIINTERQDVGEAILTETPNGVLLALSLHDKPRGIEPGVHAFHVHAVGKCEPPFASAGAHYNREGKKHGFLAKGGSHAGDLPNIHVSKNGRLRWNSWFPA